LKKNRLQILCIKTILKNVKNITNIKIRGVKKHQKKRQRRNKLLSFYKYKSYINVNLFINYTVLYNIHSDTQ